MVKINYSRTKLGAIELIRKVRIILKEKKTLANPSSSCKEYK